MSAVPNILTALRLLAVPLMVALFVADAGTEGTLRWAALVVFVAAAATDLLDGYLARRWRVVSSFGKLADPIADKVLVLGALAMLAGFDEIPWWPFIVLAVREVAVTLGRLAVASGTVIPASAGGKVKTVMLNVALGAMILPVSAAWVDQVAWWLLIAALALAVVTGVDYGAKIARAARAQRKAPVRDPAEPRKHDVV
jgi:CDP-diacylglycerol--glycerol-3-phosphate 3-phosphatidyltransferase